MDWVVDFLTQHPDWAGLIFIGPYLLVAVVGLVGLLLLTIFGGAKP